MISLNRTRKNDTSQLLNPLSRLVSRHIFHFEYISSWEKSIIRNVIFTAFIFLVFKRSFLISILSNNWTILGRIDFFKPDGKQAVYVWSVVSNLKSTVSTYVSWHAPFWMKKRSLIRNDILCSICIPFFQPFFSNWHCTSQLLNALSRLMSRQIFHLEYISSWKIESYSKYYFYCSYIPCFQRFVSNFNFVYQINHFEYIDKGIGNLDFFKPDGNKRSTS